MKRKSIFTFCAIALMLVLSLSVLAACNKNKHNFSSEWKNDEQYHWHECVTKTHTDVADKADHTFDAGVVTKDPTEAEEGVKTFTCTVCGYQKTEAVPKLGHTFDMNKWKYDDENHWHPATCGHTDEKKDLGAHVWNEGVVTKEPTETEEGVKTYTCTTCGKTKTATIGRLDHEHTFNMEAWTFDDENHWHPATCGHTDEKKGFAAHEWNGGVVTTEPNYGVEGEKTFTCTVCKATRKEPIAALAAKDNTISFANDLVEEKTYDGLAFIIDSAKVNRQGDGEITITYKGENDTAFSATAPINAGEYTVKVSVAATAEWKGGEITTTIIINKREITLSADVFERKLGENLESGKFGLACINVAADTNNVVEWVTIGAPETYYVIGIHTIVANVLTVDNDNFELNNGVYDTVKFTVWNAPDSFYAGIKDVFTFPGNSDVMINTIIANGTVKKGDQILVNEIGKIITVNKIEKDTGTSVTEVETATAGEEVGLRISEGVTKAELNRGYMLSKPDTIIGYSKVTVTIRVYAKDEGNTAPIATGNKMVAFADTFGEVTGGVTLPEGTDIIRPGEIIENVTINFQDGKVPAFVGRRFTLKNSGKTIAECIVTAVPNATRVRSGFMLGVPGTNVIEPIELGENTFAVNLNRSDLGEMLKNAKDTDTIEIKFLNSGKDIAKYTRTPGTGEGVYNEVGGRIVGSYLIVEFYKNTG
ncbi:MAG: hypothetical protein SPH86_05620, partial [Eubacteriales bacterium]|nr:hypothetical protein [Eubacteriales bacterium]